MTEIWKQIENYETYSVSTFGNVRNNKTGKILKGNKICKSGHLQIRLINGSIRSCLQIHRLVALAFISNPENKEQVDHIDNNPTNNNLTNLRWATHQENCRNQQIATNNTSGVKGVFFNKQTQKWGVQINCNKIRTYLGSYNTIEEATIVRQLKANEAFGSFTNSCELIKI
jgi:hypothetical protein